MSRERQLELLDGLENIGARLAATGVRLKSAGKALPGIDPAEVERMGREAVRAARALSRVVSSRSMKSKTTAGRVVTVEPRPSRAKASKPPTLTGSGVSVEPSSPAVLRGSGVRITQPGGGAMVRPASARDEKREQRRRDKEQERADLEAEGKRRDREQARRDALARGEPTPRMAAAQRLVEHLRRLEHGRWTASGVEDSVMVDGARSWRAVERAAAVAVTEALAPLLAEAKAEFAAAELERDEILRRGR